MRGLPLILISLAVGYAATAALAVLRAEKGRRIAFIQAHGFEVSMAALLAAIMAVPATIFLGLPVDLLIFKLKDIPVGSAQRYQIVAIIYGIVYVIMCVILARREGGLPLRSSRCP